MSDAIPKIEFTLNTAEFDRLARTVLPQTAERGVRQVAGLIEAQAVRNAPEHTSNLINSGTTEIRGSGYRTEAEIKFTAKYALPVHEGTGIFGERGAPIVPVRAKALKITLPDGRVLFRKSVKGMKGRPFLRQAFESEGPKLRDILFG